jgi:S-formylglutathione hydrolase
MTAGAGAALVAKARCFDGWSETYTHHSESTGTEMRFTVYRPPQAEAGPVPVLYWLSGLTCTDENVTVKGGAQRYCAEHGLLFVAPDTSPRGAGVPGEGDSWELGLGASFYVDATEPKWARNYRMYSYVATELPELVRRQFPVLPQRESIFGHSMGGHGALVLALRQPGRYRSVSAFAPIAAPSQCPWGRRAFTAFLGADEAAWRRYDATALVRAGVPRQPLLVDQGDDDRFLAEQLRPELLEAACREASHPLTLRRRPSYDHSYFFVATYIGEHIAYHAAALKRP